MNPGRGPRGKVYWIVCATLLAGGAIAMGINLSPVPDTGNMPPGFALGVEAVLLGLAWRRRMRVVDVARAATLTRVRHAARLRPARTAARGEPAGPSLTCLVTATHYADGARAVTSQHAASKRTSAPST